jgi:hypothetical protein
MVEHFARDSEADPIPVAGILSGSRNRQLRRGILPLGIALHNTTIHDIVRRRITPLDTALPSSAIVRRVITVHRDIALRSSAIPHQATTAPLDTVLPSSATVRRVITVRLDIALRNRTTVRLSVSVLRVRRDTALPRAAVVAGLFAAVAADRQGAMAEAGDTTAKLSISLSRSGSPDRAGAALFYRR